jgi:hypothetical protein
MRWVVFCSILFYFLFSFLCRPIDLDFFEYAKSFNVLLYRKGLERRILRYNMDWKNFSMSMVQSVLFV